MDNADMDDVVRELAEKMVSFLETGTAPEGLFAPDAFLDLTMPAWRIQAAGAPAGFVFEFEERWNHEGQEWYSRELIRVEVAGQAQSG